MRHLAPLTLVLLIAAGLPAWAEDDVVPATQPPAAGAEGTPAPAEAPTTPAAGQVPILQDLPIIPPIPPIPPLPPAPGTKAATPAAAQEGTPAPSERSTLPLRNAILDIRKTHNLPWRCECMAVRLDIDFMVVGQKGQYIGARVDLYSQNGQPIQSVLLPFANRRGQVSAWTSMVRMTDEVARMHTALMVPYRAFPCPCDGDSYLVTARVLLLRQTRGSQASEIARGETTFTVWSSKESTSYPGLGPTDLDGREAGTPQGYGDTGTDAERPADDDFVKQTPFAEWPDTDTLEGEMQRQAEELPKRAAAELDDHTPVPMR